jgi:putative transposase
VVRFGKPGVFNTDRAPVYCCSLHRHVGSAGGRIPMDDRGRWMDSMFIERLWRAQARGHPSQGLWRRLRA